MSRRSYQARRDARSDWPRLADVLTRACHGSDDRLVQADLADVIASMSVDDRKSTAEEWWRWNASVGATDDIRFAIEALDSGIAFDTAMHARHFMNDLYDRLVVSIRGQTGERWKP